MPWVPTAKGNIHTGNWSFKGNCAVYRSNRTISPLKTPIPPPTTTRNQTRGRKVYVQNGGNEGKQQQPADNLVVFLVLAQILCQRMGIPETDSRVSIRSGSHRSEGLLGNNLEDRTTGKTASWKRFDSSLEQPTRASSFAGDGGSCVLAVIISLSSLASAKQIATGRPGGDQRGCVCERERERGGAEKHAGDMGQGQVRSGPGKRANSTACMPV